MSQPTIFPDWALAPNAQGSLNEQQTITFTGVPVQGSFVLGIGSANTAAINWNDSNTTILSKINAAYAAAQATVASGTIAGGSLVIDFGTFSLTNFIAQMTYSQNTMLTAGSAAVGININVTQATQLPALVTPDSAHINGGWMLFEKPAFNFFNSWMNTVGLWIRWISAFPFSLPSFLNNGSSPVIPVASGDYCSGSANITLTPGTWELTGFANTLGSISDTFKIYIFLAESDGADNASKPGTILSAVGVTCKSNVNSIQSYDLFSIVTNGEKTTNLPKTILAITSNTNVYLVPEVICSTPSDVTISTYILASLINSNTS